MPPMLGTPTIRPSGQSLETRARRITAGYPTHGITREAPRIAVTPAPTTWRKTLQVLDMAGRGSASAHDSRRSVATAVPAIVTPQVPQTSALGTNTAAPVTDSPDH